MRNENSATFKEKAIGVGLCIVVIGFFSYASYNKLDAVTAKNNCKEVAYEFVDNIKTVGDAAINAQVEYREDTGNESPMFFPKTVETIKKHDLLGNEKSNINKDDAKLDGKPFLAEINMRKENVINKATELVAILENSNILDGDELSTRDKKSVKTLCKEIRKLYNKDILEVPFPDRLKEQQTSLEKLNKNLEMELKLLEDSIKDLQPNELNEAKLVLRTFIDKCNCIEIA